MTLDLFIPNEGRSPDNHPLSIDLAVSLDTAPPPSVMSPPWENEGGHSLPANPSPRSPTVGRTWAGADTAKLAAEIHRLRRRLSNDFANGLVGARYNTYQHRSRLIRQLSATLKALDPRPVGLSEGAYRHAGI